MKQRMRGGKFLLVCLAVKGSKQNLERLLDSLNLIKLCQIRFM